MDLKAQPHRPDGPRRNGGATPASPVVVFAEEDLV